MLLKISRKMKLVVLICVTFAVVNALPVDDQPELSIETTLKKVAILFRHGDRSLHDVGGSGGSAQLTLQGEKHMFRLGNYIRKRYQTFLTNNTSEVQARSIALNRCINSLLVVLAGMYPALDNSTQIVEGLEWQPIPISMKPLEQDPVLFTESWCPRENPIWPTFRKGPIIQKLNEDNQDFFKMISEKSGRRIKDFVDASHYQDDLLVHKVENMPLPEWLTDDIYEKLESFTDLLYTYKSIDPLQQRLRGGPFIQEAINVLSKNESEIIRTGAQDDEDEAPHKLYIYAAKRYPISLVLSAMNVFNNRSPLAGASLFFELHEFKGNDYFRLYHLNDSDSGIVYPLTPRGCPSFDCPWDTFVESVQPFIPEDLEKECSLPEENVSLPDSISSSTNSLSYSPFLQIIPLIFSYVVLSLLSTPKTN